MLSADQVDVAHFDDCPADVPREEQFDEHRVLPGEGIFDLSRYLHVLQQMGYDRFLLFELFRQDLWYRDPVEVAAEGMAKMQKVVAG